MRGIIFFRHSLITLIVAACGALQLSAQTSDELAKILNPQVGESVSADVRGLTEAFSKLYQNRLEYNAIEEDIFSPADRQSWIEGLLHRSERFKEMYRENNAILSTIDGYVSRDVTEMDSTFIEYFTDYFQTLTKKSVFDPYIMEPMALKMLPKVEQAGTDVQKARLYRSLADINYLFYSSTESDKLADYKYYSSKILDLPEDVENDELVFTKCMAHINLLISILLRSGLITEDEFDRYCDRAVSYSDIIPARRASLRRTFMQSVNLRKEFIVHNYWLNKYTVGNNAKADSVFRAFIAPYEDEHALSLTRNTLTYMAIKSEFEPERATEYALKADSLLVDAFNALRTNAQTKNTSELNNIVQYTFDVIYLVDKSDLTFEQKHDLIWRYMTYAHELVSLCMHSGISYMQLKPLTTFATYSKAMKYLSTEEKIQNIRTLIITTSPTTFAHSAMVSDLSHAILRGVIKYEPQLLYGILGIKTKRDVRSRQQEIFDYVENASMYHDLGKISISGLVDNDFAKLPSHAFDVIKMHPSLGLKFLMIDDDLAKYSDVVLGHHKWYDGTNGYPAEYDNTKSPVRILTDIISISDCLEAATDRLGRNYSDQRLFETLMEELEGEAGTRYNPDIIRLIQTHPDVKQEIKNLVEHGWLDVYYDIYKEYFGQ